MNINEFSDLSDFTLGEVEKIGDFVDGVGPSKKLIKYMNNQIMKYAKLYSKPLLKTEKQKIKILEAIDTMPHGFLWKLFHTRLWKQVKAELKAQGMINKYEEEKKESQPEKQVFYPVIVQESSVPEIYEEDEEENEE